MFFYYQKIVLPLQTELKIKSMKKLFTLLLVILAISSVNAQSDMQGVSASPVDTIDVVCHDLELNTDFIGLFRMAYIFANNGDYKLTGAIIADSIPPGTYTDCMMDLKHIPSQKMISAQSVTLTLAVDHNRNCVITGTMIGDDNICYNLDLSWTVAEPTDTVAISFASSAWVAYYPDLANDFMLVNETDTYNIALDIVGVDMGENFTEKNLNIPYCLIANKLTNDSIKIAAAKGRVWQSNDTTYLSAEVIGFDAILYDIDLWYAVPTVTETVHLDIYNATFYNELESDGYYALVGITNDRNIEFAISLLGNSLEEISGNFINDGVFGSFSGKNYDFINYIGGSHSTYIAKWNTIKSDYDIITIEQGEARVTMDEEENVTLVGTFIGKDGVEYHINMTSKVDKPHFEDDEQVRPINRTIYGKNGVTIQNNIDKDATIMFELFTDNELMALWFIAEEPDDDIIIPEGVYPIDDSDDYGSVIPSDGSLGKSFYATHDGVYFTSLYFLVSGTVEVRNNNGHLYMEINAVNSYDVPVHIIYDEAGTTHVDSPTAPAIDTKKILQDGHLLIESNGSTYNIFGSKQ